MPRSMCSWMPNPKFPLAEKFSFLSSYSLTLKPRSRISSAFAPLHNGAPFRQEQENARGHRYEFKVKSSTFNVFQFTIELLGMSGSRKYLLSQATLALALTDPGSKFIHPRSKVKKAPDPGSKSPRIQGQKGPGSAIKNLSIFNPKIVTKPSEIMIRPKCLSRIRI